MVVRDLCGSPSPIPLPKQGHLQQAAQDLVQAGLEYLDLQFIYLPVNTQIYSVTGLGFGRAFRKETVLPDPF